MAYNYLLDLYRVLDERRRLLETEPLAAAADSPDYRRGQLDCLIEFKTFLSDNFHHKLPGRIRRTLR